jgi:hypothetical protein
MSGETISMRVLNRMLLLVAALGVSLMLAGSASAKGPIAATITGPGLASPLKLSYRSVESRDVMAKLTSDGDFFRQAFTSMPARPGARRPPAGSLGPRYLVVYTVPGPRGNSLLRQHLYPYASAGAVTFMPRGQRFWGTYRTRGGWSRSSPALAATLVAAGLPPQP